MAVMTDDAGHLGIQFHPEVVHTPQGEQIIRNFLFGVAGCRGDWTATSFVEESVEAIREQVGNGAYLTSVVFFALSLYLASGLLGGQMHGFVESFLPARKPVIVGVPGMPAVASQPGVVADVDSSGWLENYGEAVRAGRAAGKNVFIDFTGIACVACKRMENTVFIMA